MAQDQIPLIKGDRIGIETDYRDALPVNMYAVAKEILGASGYMIQFNGISSFSTGSGIDRGGVYNERFGKHFRVSGTDFIEVDALGGVTVLGTVPGTGPAYFPYSFNTQAIIADGNMFQYSPSGGFVQITDPDLGSPLNGVWINGYYFMTDGEYIYHTLITDETQIDPLQYATAEFMPDGSLAVAKTQDNKVVVFGRFSTEYFYDAANDDFAFTRIENRAQKIGIVATGAWCESQNGFYITGGRKNEQLGVHAVGTGTAEKVSTREIDKILSDYSESDLVNMSMESISISGTRFIIVHLPNETLCFNESIAQTNGIQNAWCILKSDIQGEKPFRGIYHVFDPRCSKWICGDRQNGNIGYVDLEKATQYGNKVEWLLYTPFVKIERQSIQELSIETVSGHTSTDDATVAVSCSYDGVSYGRELWCDYGPPNDYEKRFILRRLGYVRNWIGFKFRGASESRMAFALMRIIHG